MQPKWLLVNKIILKENDTKSANSTVETFGFFRSIKRTTTPRLHSHTLVEQFFHKLMHISFSMNYRKKINKQHFHS